MRRSAIRAQILDLVGAYTPTLRMRPRHSSPASPVPVSGTVYDARRCVKLVDSALDFWLTTGRFNDGFEARAGRALGVQHALTVNSGSSANLLAFSALTSPICSATGGSSPATR